MWYVCVTCRKSQFKFSVVQSKIFNVWTIRKMHCFKFKFGRWHYVTMARTLALSILCLLFLSFSLNTIAIEWCTQVHALNWNICRAFDVSNIVVGPFSRFQQFLSLHTYIFELTRVWGFNQFNERQDYIQTLLCAMFTIQYKNGLRSNEI